MIVEADVFVNTPALYVSPEVVSNTTLLKRTIVEMLCGIDCPVGCLLNINLGDEPPAHVGGKPDPALVKTCPAEPAEPFT